MDVLLLGGENWESFGCLCPPGGAAVGINAHGALMKFRGMGCWCPLSESRSCWDIAGAVPAVGKERGEMGFDSSAAAQVVPNPGACR